MNRFRRYLPASILLASATCAIAADPGTLPPNSRPLPPSQQARLVEGYGKLPLSFEANQGQTDPQVKFLSRGDGYSLSLTSSEAVLSLHGNSCFKPPKLRAMEHLKNVSQPCSPSPDSVLRMRLLGSNPDTQIRGEVALPGKSNYFRGNDPSSWHTNIANYRKVQYRDIYPGIDLVYYGSQRLLEHDFIVKPGADPSGIRISFAGAERIVVNAEGDLSLATRNGSVTLRKPVVYQDYGGKRRLIHSRYQRNEHDEVGFVIGNYDRRKELIVDPVLAYSGFFGQPNSANAIAVDSDGNAYVTGYGSGEFSVTKVKADGSALLYTSLFGNAGPESIAVDTQGNAYVTGGADSINEIPVVNALQSKPVGGGSAFLMKLDPTGSKLIYSTFFGGGNSIGLGVAVDASGSAYLTGISGSGMSLVHPISTNPGGFVAKFSPSGTSLEYSTYLAGKNIDGLYSIAVDAAGEAIVTGAAQSPDFPIVNGLYTQCIATPYYTCLNTVVAKINRAGTALIYSTFLGAGTGDGVATNAEGDAFVVGRAVSKYFPVVNAMYSTNPANYAPYVARINPTGSALVYSTFLGNVTGTFAYSIAVDSASNAYVAGEARGGFPNINGVQATYAGGAGDAFLSKIAPDGSKFIYSTFLGGTKHDFAQAVGVDAIGDAFIVGYTESSNFPLRGGFNFEHHYYPSYFIAKISDQKQFSITDTVDKATVNPGGDLRYTITITNTGSESASGEVAITSLRDRFRTCTVSNGDPCRFVVLGGRASVDISSLPGGTSRTILIYATAAKTAGDYNSITNTAAIAGVSASATTTVRESADIGIASSLVDSTNGLLHYVHTVTNLGPDNAHAVLLLDPLPANTTYVSASTTQGKCSFHPTIGANGAVRCPLNNPDSGSSVQVDVVLQASSLSNTSIANTTSISSQSIDPNPANDAATVVTQLP